MSVGATTLSLPLVLLLGVITGGCLATIIILIVGRRLVLQLRESVEKSERSRQELEVQISTERSSHQEFREFIKTEATRNEQRDRALEERTTKLDERALQLQEDSKLIAQREGQLAQKINQIELDLSRIANLTKQEAKAEYLASIEAEFRDDAAKRAQQIEQEATRETERKARKLLVEVMQRSAVEYVTEATLAVVELPSEDMKGRIIGREGRNIRAFEQVAGVDLIVDETPEAVVISSFDPVRREIARLALMNLMVDGRIHPARIEELFEKAKLEVNRMILEAGERAATRANVADLAPGVIETLGKLRFRTSFAQNVLDHSVEVSVMAAGLAAELGLNVEQTKRAGLLHDIGKALGPEFEGPHALTGMSYLKSFGETDLVLNAVGAHHNEIEPTSAEAVLVIIADQVSAARPGARRESLDNYIKRLTNLEELANAFPGVDRSFAVQAGREIRLIVKPEEVDDLGARRIAMEVAAKIKSELDIPGQVKVTVVRELRVSEISK